MKEIQQRVVTDSKGRRVFIQDTPQVSITVEFDNSTIISEQPAGELTISELQAIITKTPPDSDTIGSKDMATTNPETETADSESDKA